MSNDLLVFSLGQQQFALPVRQVSTVVPRASLTALPGAPTELIGVLRLRGELHPVIDIRPRLGLAAAAPHIGECIVVMQTTASKVGLLVDGVEGLVSLAADPLELTMVGDGSRVVRSVLEASGRVVATLDADAAVGSEVRAYLAAAASGAHRQQARTAA
jgi:purine-binding chemotaxis protein CheW